MDNSYKLNSGVETMGLCPHCGQFGVGKSSDIWGDYYECIYCGYHKDITPKNPSLPELDILDLEGKYEGGRTNGKRTRESRDTASSWHEG